MRSYTVGHVRPNLVSDPDKFLPQSVPAFGATEIMTLLRKKYRTTRTRKRPSTPPTRAIARSSGRPISSTRFATTPRRARSRACARRRPGARSTWRGRCRSRMAPASPATPRRTVASFRHPHIVRVMRFFEANGTAYGDGVRRRCRPPRLGQDPPATERSAGYLARRTAARRPASGAQVGCPAPRYQARQYLHTRGRHAGTDRLRLRSQRASELTAIVSPGYAPFEQYRRKATRGRGATSTRSAACCTGW